MTNTSEGPHSVCLGHTTCGSEVCVADDPDVADCLCDTYACAFPKCKIPAVPVDGMAGTFTPCAT